MNAVAVQKGLLPGGLSYARLGNGPRTVVIFPGLADAAWDVTSRKWNFSSRHQRLVDAFTVYIISRKRGLPHGYTTKDMAADYPDHVKRLVIACAAHRVSEEGRKTPERWLALAHEGRWREFYQDIARVTMQEYRHTFKRFLIPLLQTTPCNPPDFLVSLEACIGHDGLEPLARIQAPTLVIGGTEDIFFPPSLLRETASRIPNANLQFIVGGGHSAYELHKKQFEDAVLEFLHGHEAALPAADDQPVLASEGHEVEVAA